MLIPEGCAKLALPLTSLHTRPAVVRVWTSRLQQHGIPAEAGADELSYHPVPDLGL